MTEAQVYRKMLTTLSVRWGKGRFGNGHTEPYCIMGHLNYATLGYTNGRPGPDNKVYFKVLNRLSKNIPLDGYSPMGYNDRTGVTKADIIALVTKCLVEVEPSRSSPSKSSRPPQRRWWQTAKMHQRALVQYAHDHSLQQ